MRRRFRIYRCTCGAGCQHWRWTCTLCDPPARGARWGGWMAWHAIVAISLPHHFEVRHSHHEWVWRSKGAMAA